MANRREKTEVENVHNHIYHPEIQRQFKFFLKINRTVLRGNFKYLWLAFTADEKAFAPLPAAGRQ